MKNKIMVWGYFLAGGLWVIAALRDLFAPGFFAMNGRVISKGEIIGEFAIAIVLLSIGVWSSRHRQVDGLESK